MPQTIDPWHAASNARKLGERKKSIRLAGNGPDKAHTLLKFHKWRGRAIYVYHLGKTALKRVDKPSAEEWDAFAQLGVPLKYPFPDHPASDVAFWVNFGREQAQELGLKVIE